MGRGIPWVLCPSSTSEFSSNPEFSDEGAGVRVHFHHNGAAEAVDGAHHIMAADEIGGSDRAIVVKAQRVIDADAFHHRAMEVAMKFVAEFLVGYRAMVIAVVPHMIVKRSG